MISSQVLFIFHIPYHIFIFHIILFPRLLWYTNLFHSMINSQLSIYSGLTSTWQGMFLFLDANGGHNSAFHISYYLFIFHIIFSDFKLSFQISYYLFIFYIILLMVMWGHDGAGQKDGWGGHFLEWDKIFILLNNRVMWVQQHEETGWEYAQMASSCILLSFKWIYISRMPGSLLL